MTAEAPPAERFPAVPPGSHGPPVPPAAKEVFTALDTLALAREIRQLPKAWFDKAYDLPGDRLRITFRVQGEGKAELVVQPGRFAYLTPRGSAETEPPSSPPPVRTEAPGQLVQALRRHLAGAPLLSVAQPEGERYLELSFGRGGEEVPALLALELFGTGNVVLVRQGRIAAVLERRVWAGRRLRPGEPYVAPPARADPFHRSAGDVTAVLQRSRVDLASTLAARLGLGGPLAEEVVARCGLARGSPAAADPEGTAERVVRALATILLELGDAPRGYLYRPAEGAPPVDATPFRPQRWGEAPGGRIEEVARFSEAVRTLVEERARAAPPVPTPRQSAREARRLELLRLAEQQRGTIAGLEEAMALDRSAAETLLTNYEGAQQALEAARGEGPAGEEAMEVDVVVAGRTIRVAVWRPLRESAQALFDAAKRRLPKLEGARRALEETEGAQRALRAEEERDAAKAARARAPPAADGGIPGAGEEGGRPDAAEGRGRRWGRPRQRYFWFEKAPRWMVSARGVVAVAGRDARSNDGVVKRYLRERDVYIHADLQGAPSVVVKRPAPGATPLEEASLREIAQWGVACSKAWRAGLASADAFWVEGSQVSKAGASGEFVARGAWVIHGTRHFVRDLPLELSLGRMEHEGEVLLQVAPPSCFRVPGGKELWRIAPGEERDREAVEREVAQDLGISRERLQALLPPGGLRAQRA